MTSKARLAAIASSCLFFSLGTSLIPYAGIQNDEALFANPLFQGVIAPFRLRIFHHDVPLMVMSYVGTLKTMIYWLIFKAISPNAFSVRLPMVAAGAVTVWLLFRLVARISHPAAGVFAAGLLATDPTFVLTNTFDWGPTALEHLLVICGCLSAIEFAQGVGSRRWPAMTGFCFGLALWNKATFLWSLLGLCVSALIVLWPELRVCIKRPRDVSIALTAFVLGAFPILLYNIRQPNVTLGSNAKIEDSHFLYKAVQLRNSLEGSALFGYIANDGADGKSKAPGSAVGRMAAWIGYHFGQHHTTGMIWAVLLCFLSVPVWIRQRAALFSLLFVAVGWLAMLLTRDAGGAAHHVVLLWPFPHIFVGVVIASLQWRRLAALAMIILIASNLLVVNQYVLQLAQEGAAGSFTDAIFPLSAASELGSAENIYIIDWGVLNSLSLLHSGRLPLHIGSDPFMTATPSPLEQRAISQMLADPRGLFVGHVAEREEFAGVRARLLRSAEERGYQRFVLRTVTDSNTRPVFEMFRFQRP